LPDLNIIGWYLAFIAESFFKLPMGRLRNYLPKKIPAVITDCSSRLAAMITCLALNTSETALNGNLVVRNQSVGITFLLQLTT